MLLVLYIKTHSLNSITILSYFFYKVNAIIKTFLKTFKGGDNQNTPKHPTKQGWGVAFVKFARNSHIFDGAPTKNYISKNQNLHSKIYILKNQNLQNIITKCYANIGLYSFPMVVILEKGPVLNLTS